MTMKECYDWLTKIGSLDFEGKSVLLIGAGNIAKHYVAALSRMNIADITIIANSKNKASDFANKSKIKFLSGGFEKNLPSVERKDLVIIATPITSLVKAAEHSIRCGQNNILIEKPGALYSGELTSLAKKIGTQKVRIAYNRLSYPSLHKLKKLIREDGGILSCRFTITEWLDKIDLTKDSREVYQRWGISNSLHVISMALELVGMPKKIHAEQYGQLKWHKSGSIFVGSGITQESIPFSYHADWKSGGRWGIEIFTEKTSYRLVPLEELHMCPKNKTNWKPIQLKTAFPSVKAGLAEQISLMLSHKIETKTKLVTLDEAAKLIKIAEQIFGYKTR